jgi:hypothetical protein
MKRRKRLFIDISVRFAPQLSALSSWNVYLRLSNSLCVSGILPGTVVWRISLDTTPSTGPTLLVRRLSTASVPV